MLANYVPNVLEWSQSSFSLISYYLRSTNPTTLSSFTNNLFN